MTKLLAQFLIVSLCGALISQSANASGSGRPAPAHPPVKPLAASAFPSNAQLSAASLVGITTAIATAQKDPSLKVGLVTLSRLTKFSNYDPEMGKGALISGDRQIYELTFGFPSGTKMRMGTLGANARAVVAVDAQTGTILAVKWTGPIVKAGGPPGLP